MSVLNATTRLSLLQRLKDEPRDESAWAEFVNIYGPAIHRWCQHYGLQPADAEDVSQNVLLKIARHMRRFERREGGRFRSWLKTVVHNAWHDFCRSKQVLISGDEAAETLLASAEAADDLLDRIAHEYDHQVLAEAMQRVMHQVKPHIWKAFELIALQGVAVDEVAERLQLTKGNAYVCKNRVQKMLTEEVARLERLGF